MGAKMGRWEGGDDESWRRIVLFPSLFRHDPFAGMKTKPLSSMARSPVKTLLAALALWASAAHAIGELLLFLLPPFFYLTIFRSGSASREIQ